MIRDYFSLIAWHDYAFVYGVDFTFFRARIDSFGGHPERVKPYAALDVALLGLHVSLTFWPKGKAS